MIVYAYALKSNSEGALVLTKSNLDKLSNKRFNIKLDVGRITLTRDIDGVVAPNKDGQIRIRKTMVDMCGLYSARVEIHHDKIEIFTIKETV